MRLQFRTGCAVLYLARGRITNGYAAFADLESSCNGNGCKVPPTEALPTKLATVKQLRGKYKKVVQAARKSLLLLLVSWTACWVLHYILYPKTCLLTVSWTASCLPLAIHCY